MIGRPDDLTLRRILAETRSIAVVGASDKPTRPSNEIYSYLLATGQFQVYPVNPTITEIDGARMYSRLADLPVVPDMVDVFRRFDDLPSVLARHSPSRSARKPCGCKKVCGMRKSGVMPMRPACRS
jgi:predicted CoA-binding protein